MSLEFSFMSPNHICVNISINEYYNKHILLSNNNNKAFNFLNNIIKKNQLCQLNDINRNGRSFSIIYDNQRYLFEITIWSNFEKDIYIIPCFDKIINNINLITNPVSKI